MRRPIRRWGFLAVGLFSLGMAPSCDKMSDLASPGVPVVDLGYAPCPYKADDAAFCECMKWNCGGTTIIDSTGSIHSVYCGACSGTEYCESGVWGVGVG